MFDPDRMLEIVEASFTTRLTAQYGPHSGDALRELLLTVKAVHGSIPYELWDEGLTIFAPMEPLAESPFVDEGATVDVSGLVNFIGFPLTIRASGAEQLTIWTEAADPTELANDALVYHFNELDHFVIDGNVEPVINPTGFPSLFGTPTFVELDRALNHYGQELARHSSCLILQDCWEADDRMIFVNKPESTMRDSLHQFLRSSLRGYREVVEVRPEQNVDASHPVDIKVIWNHSNRRALIEIKWVGDSRTQTGGVLKYRDARAREGAQQLSDYLDANQPFAPSLVTTGVLVVYDARRKASDPRHYVDKEMHFDPLFDELRIDFAPPRRWFLEPA